MFQHLFFWTPPSWSAQPHHPIVLCSYTSGTRCSTNTKEQMMNVGIHFAEWFVCVCVCVARQLVLWNGVSLLCRSGKNLSGFWQCPGMHVYLWILKRSDEIKVTLAFMHLRWLMRDLPNCDCKSSKLPDRSSWGSQGSIDLIKFKMYESTVKQSGLISFWS